MKKNGKERLFEVMGKLDKSFKPRLNEGIEDIMDTKVEDEPKALPAEADDEKKEKTSEEKIAELTAKIDELYALLHDEGDDEEESEETAPEEIQEKKETEFEKEEKKESKKHEDSETPEEEKNEHEEKEEIKEAENNGKKIPVAAVAKVGK